VVLFGAGTAGIGIAEQLRDAMIADGLTPREAAERIWAVDRHGLLTEGQQGLRDFQMPFARGRAEVADWRHDENLGGVPLAEVVDRVRPSVLIGTSGQGGAFTEDIVRSMAAHTDRPVVLPLSNPTRLAEAVPADLLAWTGGRALIATGSPFEPVETDGVTHHIGQANNALVFPGLGLGTAVARAERITDGMLVAAARAIADQTDPGAPGAPILPPIDRLRDTSVAVAVAVARAAVADGVARESADDTIEERVRAAMWHPVYPPIEAV
jgi:malate dehydrogenase (oxaloacetate-decarboxylating)